MHALSQGRQSLDDRGSESDKSQTMLHQTPDSTRLIYVTKRPVKKYAVSIKLKRDGKPAAKIHAVAGPRGIAGCPKPFFFDFVTGSTGSATAFCSSQPPLQLIVAEASSCQQIAAFTLKNASSYTFSMPWILTTKTITTPKTTNNIVTLQAPIPQPPPPALLPKGSACSTGAQCSSGYCTDSACCESSCSSLCTACSAS